jgi:hypothetical protein
MYLVQFFLDARETSNKKSDNQANPNPVVTKPRIKQVKGTSNQINQPSQHPTRQPTELINQPTHQPNQK